MSSPGTPSRPRSVSDIGNCVFQCITFTRYLSNGSSVASKAFQRRCIFRLVDCLFLQSLPCLQNLLASSAPSSISLRLPFLKVFK
ncbi:hypothetical protein Nepgr_029739 [Nepenthes gracilis]|uniref:Uncharacterized protein n=1 Tax=Nepenthes gracilis TaxID=150966 RepID=A0AAD3TEV7_NEPGR|nr:hypothetical protein Nepgr_029739 [Nepenthes gracilis]